MRPGEQRERRVERAAGADRLAEQELGRFDGHAGAEHALDRRALGAVRAGVAADAGPDARHARGTQSRARERLAHGALGALAGRVDRADAERVARDAVVEQLAVHARAARERVRAALEQQRDARLGQREAAAVAVGQRAESAVAGDHRVRQRVGGDRDHGVGVAAVTVEAGPTAPRCIATWPPAAL